MTLSEKEFKKNLIEAMKNHIDLELSDGIASKFYLYKNFLVEENEKYNLTRITDDIEVIYKHFVDSVYILKFDFIKNNLQNKKIIDIGTGAGFPGMPLAIVLNDSKFTLVDSLSKRTKFLNQLVQILDLKNVEVIHSRTEDLGQNKNYREKFDFVVSRAVANFSVLSEWTLPFLKNDGEGIYYKLADCDEELRAATNAFKTLGECEIKKYDYENLLMENDALHTIVIAKKKKTIDKKYPRKAGTIEKNPL